MRSRRHNQLRGTLRLERFNIFEIVDRLLASAADRSGHRSSVLDQIQGEIRTLCGDRSGDLLERLAEGMELDDHYEPARRVFGEFLASIPAPEAARHQDHAAPFASRAAYQRYLDELFVDLRRTWLSFADILGCWGSLMDAARRLRETEDLPLRF